VGSPFKYNPIVVNWQDAYDIRHDGGTYDVYKKNSEEMVAYCKTMEEAVRICEIYFKNIQEVADDFLLGLGDELAD
jgi:hypothetical protein